MRSALPRMSYRARAVLILVLDAVVTAGSLWLAYLLRFEGELPAAELDTLLLALPLLAAARIAANVLFRLHRWSFRLSGLTDGARIAMSGLFGTGIFTLGLYLYHRGAGMPPRSVVVLELLLSTTLMAFIRFAPRLAWLYRTDLLRGRRRAAERTLIVGAGAAGEMLLRDLRRSAKHNVQVVGFVDDNPGKRGSIVGGREVLGTVADLPRIVARHEVTQVLIAIPRLPATRVREMLTLCSTLKLKFKILPYSCAFLQRQAAVVSLQDLSPEDLLAREEVFLHPEGLRDRQRCRLVTGGAGSIGSEVCSQLLALGCCHLVMLDVDENGLYMLKRRLECHHPDAVIAAEVGDVRDVARLESIFSHYRPFDVFHAAARKHVPLMEAAPAEAVKTNVIGTRNVARVAERYGAERFVYMSTDKAVRPTSVMGATKRLGELLLQQMDAASGTHFLVVRFGNVLGSAGSAVPLFLDQIAAGGPVTITHPDARRFFMTISEAVGLVLRAAYADHGSLCVLDMGEPIRILDLARHMITMSGHVPDIDIKIEISGLRPGEKLVEELLGDGETVVRRVDRKIQVVEGPAVRQDLGQWLDSLAEAARREDARQVRRLLHEVVEDYRGMVPLSTQESSSVEPLPDLDGPIM